MFSETGTNSFDILLFLELFNFGRENVNKWASSEQFVANVDFFKGTANISKLFRSTLTGESLSLFLFNFLQNFTLRLFLFSFNPQKGLFKYKKNEEMLTPLLF